MKLTTKRALKVTATLSLTCLTMTSPIYAEDTNNLYNSKLEVINMVNEMSQIFDMSPNVVMATYIELGGNILDNEFLDNYNKVTSEEMLDKLVKVYNTSLTDSFSNLSYTLEDEAKYILNNGNISAEDCLNYLNTDSYSYSNTCLALKDSYLDLGDTLYKDWSNLVVESNNYTNNSSNTLVDYKDTKVFNFVVNRGRLGDAPIRVTSQYAYRDNGQMHRALDFATKEFIGENGKQGELNLYPVNDCKIVRIQNNPNTDTGLSVWYEFKYGSDTYNIVYMHMNSINEDLYVGAEVSKNTHLGVSGSTGDASGIHIHMQVEKNGVRINPLKLWGYDIYASAEDRLNWFIDNNFAIQCSGECMQSLNFTSEDREFSVVKCKYHR